MCSGQSTLKLPLPHFHLPLSSLLSFLLRFLSARSCPVAPCRLSHVFTCLWPRVCVARFSLHPFWCRPVSCFFSVACLGLYRVRTWLVAVSSLRASSRSSSRAVPGRSHCCNTSFASVSCPTSYSRSLLFFRGLRALVLTYLVVCPPSPSVFALFLPPPASRLLLFYLPGAPLSLPFFPLSPPAFPSLSEFFSPQCSFIPFPVLARRRFRHRVFVLSPLHTPLKSLFSLFLSRSLFSHCPAFFVLRPCALRSSPRFSRSVSLAGPSDALYYLCHSCSCSGASSSGPLSTSFRTAGVAPPPHLRVLHCLPPACLYVAAAVLSSGSASLHSRTADLAAPPLPPLSYACASRAASCLLVSLPAPGLVSHAYPHSPRILTLGRLACSPRLPLAWPSAACVLVVVRPFCAPSLLSPVRFDSRGLPRAGLFLLLATLFSPSIGISPLIRLPRSTPRPAPVRSCALTFVPVLFHSRCAPVLWCWALGHARRPSPSRGALPAPPALIPPSSLCGAPHNSLFRAVLGAGAGLAPRPPLAGCCPPLCSPRFLVVGWLRPRRRRPLSRLPLSSALPPPFRVFFQSRFLVTFPVHRPVPSSSFLLLLFSLAFPGPLCVAPSLPLFLCLHFSCSVWHWDTGQLFLFPRLIVLCVFLAFSPRLSCPLCSSFLRLPWPAFASPASPTTFAVHSLLQACPRSHLSLGSSSCFCPLCAPVPPSQPLFVVPALALPPFLRLAPVSSHLFRFSPTFAFSKWLGSPLHFSLPASLMLVPIPLTVRLSFRPALLGSPFLSPAFSYFSFASGLLTWPLPSL